MTCQLQCKHAPKSARHAHLLRCELAGVARRLGRAGATIGAIQRDNGNLVRVAEQLRSRNCSNTDPARHHQGALPGSDRFRAVFDDVEPSERKLVIYPHRVTWEADGAVIDKGEGTPVLLEPAEPLRAECAHFLHCIRSGARPITDGAEALRVMDVLVRASEAMQGEPVTSSGRWLGLAD